MRKLLLPLALPAFLLGCSKNSSQQSGTPQSVDLGVTELTYEQPSTNDIGRGQVCILTARTMDATSFELLASLQKGKKQIATTRIMPAKIGAPVQLSLGNVQVQLTPKIKQ
ncbi:MAG TPA: hypothetical protein VLT36_08690 [Candidatus Dormibacteraeota bacterium]|nr:hypothetical protein [Candidatus Dormibacteraeota bacterium]